MSTQTAPTPHKLPTVIPRLGIPLVPIAGAVLACLALVSAMVVGPEGTAVPTSVLAIGAGLCFVIAIGARVRHLSRTPEAPLIALIGLAAAILFLGALVAGVPLVPIGAFFVGAAGGSLAGAGALRLMTIRSATPTPWAAFRGVSANDAATLLASEGARILSGAIVILVAILGNPPAAALGAVITIAILASRHEETLRPTPAGNTTKTRRPTDEVAAHLHDSVLQTLALIQRNAHDPAKVAQLARRQEHSLRDWLAGRDGAGRPDTVAASLRAIAAEVEGEVVGTTVDVVTVGQTPLDRRSEMLMQAAREAMRNAARHGSTKVRVFAETDATGTRIFIRDTGGGFCIDTVPTDRRGIRDAIIGRMDHVDGTVVIDSGDHGTEIELYLPARPG